MSDKSVLPNTPPHLKSDIHVTQFVEENLSSTCRQSFLVSNNMLHSSITNEFFDEMKLDPDEINLDPDVLRTSMEMIDLCHLNGSLVVIKNSKCLHWIVINSAMISFIHTASCAVLAKAASAVDNATQVGFLLLQLTEPLLTCKHPEVDFLSAPVSIRVTNTPI